MHQTSWSPVWVNKSPGQAYKTYCFTHILASLLGKFYNILCIFVVELVELKFQQLFFYDQDGKIGHLPDFDYFLLASLQWPP